MKPVKTQWLAALLIPLCFAAAAQDDGARAAREREALRRTQAALRQAQEQQAALAKEKAELSAQRDQLSEQTRLARTQLAASRTDGSRLHSGLAKTELELAAVKSQAEADKKEAQVRIDALNSRLSQAVRVGDERARANAALTALLEHATRSLTTAEKANRDMHALGLQMIERLRAGGAGDRVNAADPVLGFGKIQLENTAETLRDQLDGFKLRNGVE